MITLYLAIFFVSYLLGIYFQKRRKQLKFLKHFDGPKPIPIFGNILQFSPNPAEIFKYIVELSHKYKYNAVMYGLLNDFAISINNIKDVERILSSSKMTEKSVEYTFLHKWLGTGLLVSSGTKWFSRRKILTPSFHFSILNEYIEVFQRQSTVFVNKLKKYAISEEEFNVYPMTALSALDVICEASMGVEMNAQNDPESEYVQSVNNINKIIYKRIFSIFKIFPKFHEWSPQGAEERRLVKLLHKFTNNVIMKRREKLKAEQGKNVNSCISDENEDFSIKKKMSMLDMLLNVTVDGKPLNNEDIREEVDTFMFAGHDTTTTAMAFLIYALSKNPEVQQKVYEEVKAVLHDKFTMKDLNNLPYFDLVLKESLRMYPPVPMIARQLIEDTPFNGTIVPAGTNVSILVYAFHHNPELYTNPEQFNPERFLIDEQRQRSVFCYLPFSAGNRNCIGQKFAQLEVKATIANILLHYKLLPCDVQNEPILTGDLILRSENGIRIKIAPRC